MGSIFELTCDGYYVLVYRTGKVIMHPRAPLSEHDYWQASKRIFAGGHKGDYLKIPFKPK